MDAFNINFNSFNNYFLVYKSIDKYLSREENEQKRFIADYLI